MRWRFRARPREVKVLPHRHLESAAERSLESGDIDLTIPLVGVTVSDLEQCSGRMDRNVESGARYQLLVVEIAGVDVGWRAAHSPAGRRRGNSEAAEKGRQGNVDPRREVRKEPSRVEWNDPRLGVRKVLRQESAIHSKAVVRIRN